MAKVRPFRAVTYNQEKIPSLAKVTCPPYDIISPARQEYFSGLDEHNLIHILLRKDKPGEDKYRKAGEIFREWLKEKILVRDVSPAVYFYSQEYNLAGSKLTRYGFLALLGLPEANSGVFAHEHTRAPAKEDRFKLISQVKANLSPIFVIFSDKKRLTNRIREKYLARQKPCMEVLDEDKTVHRLWKIDSPQLITSVESAMLPEDIFIADGHHRYEVACAWREEASRGKAGFTGEEPFNYLLAYFTPAQSRELTILSFHRLVRTPKILAVEEILARLRDNFDLEEIKDQARFFFLLKKSGQAEHVIGMYKDKRYFLLRLKSLRVMDNLLPNKSRGYRALDVAVLNSLILEGFLKLDLEDKEAITFHQKPEELVQGADGDPSRIAFFLNPPKVEQVMSVALAGERMPAKSTFFYPKVLSGLVINQLED